MAPLIPTPNLDVRRIRSHILRLPLFTRLIVLLIVGLWVASLQSKWDVQEWGALIPKEIGLQTSMSFHCDSERGRRGWYEVVGGGDGKMGVRE